MAIEVAQNKWGDRIGYLEFQDNGKKGGGEEMP